MSYDKLIKTSVSVCVYVQLTILGRKFQERKTKNAATVTYLTPLLSTTEYKTNQTSR